VRPPTAITAVAFESASAPERPASAKGGATGAHWRGVQAALPAIEKYCEGQGEQAASEEAVGVFEKVPAGQGVQPPDRPTARE